MPALRDQRPEGFGDLQPAQVFLVGDRATDQFEAHRVDLTGRLLDLALDLVESKHVIGPFVPIAFAIDGVEIESRAFGGSLPVVAFRTDDALHLAAAMCVAAMALESIWRAAETAIGGSAILKRSSVRAAYHDWNASGAAIALPHKAHRYRAGRRGTHHGQDYAAGTFHWAALYQCFRSDLTIGADATFRAQHASVAITSPRSCPSWRDAARRYSRRCLRPRA